MTAAKDAAQQPDVGYYVYGILPADVELTEGATGIGDPAVPLELVRSGELAALTSEVEVTGLGSPRDLLAHERLLDETSQDVPVLPFRFGAVVTGRDAIVEELLTPYHDQFLEALSDLEGRTEYLLRARYVQYTVLREVLAEHPDAIALREQIRNLPDDAGREQRIALGELIGQAIRAKSEADTEVLVDRLRPYCVALRERERTHEEDVAVIAALVETARGKKLQDAVAAIAREWERRATIRLLGPLAAYDFVPAAAEESTWACLRC
jgi:Gas vesicle synthesis protein GvpL/GvpF